ncbi:unnamed protein product [Caenorhabditis bovis]|uniref:Inhibitor of growth protein n=1 Tax=Caenorhabditis bovis TaxID=2654633 RepID=A0A8S1EXF1_9PELO|nr:unnamed protein product [Caenorhabditis bovis]
MLYLRVTIAGALAAIKFREMLFLDDFLEMLEELPAELKERSDEIKRLDIEVERLLARHRDAVDDFFERSGLTMTHEQRVNRYNGLQDEYKHIRAIAEQKYNIAQRMQDLLTKYQNHLEKEKTAFQCEMEADNSGVTGIIEKRYTEYIEGLIASRKEQRKRRHTGASSRDSVVNGILSKESTEKIARILQEGSRQRNDQSDESSSPSAQSSSVPSPAPRGRPPKFSIQNPTSGSVMLSSTAPEEPLTTPSVRNFGTPQSQPILPTFVSSESRHGRQRKLTSRAQEMFNQSLSKQRFHHAHVTTPAAAIPNERPPLTPTTVQTPPSAPRQRSTTDDGSDHDDEGSEDSRRWCFCNEKSYGDMVACDGPGCPYLWFHYPCVGITFPPPKGQWYCPHCTSVRQQAESEQQPTTSG